MELIELEKRENLELVYEEVVVTPEMAKDWIERFNGKTNRHITEQNVDAYADEMLKGNWHLNGEPISFFKSGTISDGQHRLSAVVKAGIPIKFTIVRGVDDKAKSSIDTGRNRKVKDIFGLSEIPNAMILQASIGKYIELRDGIDKTELIPSDYLEEYRRNSILWEKAIIFSQKNYAKKKILTPSEITMLYFYLQNDLNHSTLIVEKFFEELLLGKNVTNDTITTLQIKLTNAKSDAKKIDKNVRWNIIVKTWNAYIQGKNLYYLNWLEKQEPIKFI